MIEREAPDGEEEDTDVSNTNLLSQPQNNGIRVPRWLDEPEVPVLQVSFRMSATIQLRQFGDEVFYIFSKLKENFKISFTLPNLLRNEFFLFLGR